MRADRSTTWRTDGVLAKGTGPRPFLDASGRGRMTRPPPVHVTPPQREDLAARQLSGRPTGRGHGDPRGDGDHAREVGALEKARAHVLLWQPPDRQGRQPPLGPEELRGLVWPRRVAPRGRGRSAVYSRRVPYLQGRVPCSQCTSVNAVILLRFCSISGRNGLATALVFVQPP
jgi:hypothetical protein